MKKIFMVFPVLIIVLSALFKFSKAYYKYWRELKCFKKMIKKNFIEYHMALLIRKGKGGDDESAGSY